VIPAAPGARRALAIGAGALLLAGLVALLLLRGRPQAPGPREVTLGVNEVVSIDGAGQLLRLTTLARDAEGNHVLHFADASGATDAARLRTDEPTRYRGRTLTLLEVRRDRERGGAVQLQWWPEGADEPGPLFSVAGAPVPLPVAGSPFTVALVGDPPAPGPGPHTARLRVADDRRLLVEGELAAGGDLVVPGRGRLRWLGTQERYVVRLRIE
jgi:hypothetical protein